MSGEVLLCSLTGFSWELCCILRVFDGEDLKKSSNVGQLATQTTILLLSWVFFFKVWNCHWNSLWVSSRSTFLKHNKESVVLRVLFFFVLGIYLLSYNKIFSLFKLTL